MTIRIDGTDYALPGNGGYGVAESLRDLTLTVQPTAQISGTVVDADDRPVEGAYMLLRGSAAWYAYSDRGGRFAFTRVHDGGGVPVRFEVRSPRGHYDDADRTFVLCNGSRVEDVELKLARPVRVGGTVRDADGEPIGGVRVWLHSPARTSRPVVQTFTDRAGRYLLVARSGHPYGVRASWHGQDVAGGEIGDHDRGARTVDIVVK
jgi:hypothetical protein